jgi:L-aspartate oxidase
VLPFDTAAMPRIETDFVVVGSGNAGLRAAIELAEHGEVTLLAKEQADEGSTRYAQGGIAVVMNEGDRVELHVEDTLRAGAGLCDGELVRVMVEDGILRVKELLDWGAQFDRNGSQLAFGLEGAHGVRRVVHRGDATGEETQSVLVRRALTHPNVRVMEHTLAVDLLTEGGSCVGLIALTREAKMVALLARATVLASGGLGQVYGDTSNPAVTTGDGMAMAYRAGAVLADMEFVQFHPTTLFLAGAPRFLLSEALRGEGAILLNARGERFMIEYDSLEELAPRDIVSRAILAEIDRTRMPCVYLDVTRHSRSFLEERFPTIFRTCMQYGLDISRDAIPVRPAAHFMMGGVRTDAHARTCVPGLLACGEVACTMVHGANRLASNSLLEGLVFGARAGLSAAEDARRTQRSRAGRASCAAEATDAAPDAQAVESARRDLAGIMWQRVGMRRDHVSLATGLEQIAALPRHVGPTRPSVEYANMRLLAELIARAALERCESRGAHCRLDYPQRDDERWRRHILVSRSDTGDPVLHVHP